MKPVLIRDLNKVNARNIGQVGGKAASLGELLKAGIPVPPGFVITVSALPGGMSHTLKDGILAAFDRLGSPRVAVRSSALAEDSKSASWAGQLETYLNVTRHTIIKAVEECWASIRSKHATAYAAKHHISDKQKAMAVVVQTMVDSDISGVLFTANPTNGNRDQFLIEASYGLGELLVQGEITPESIVTTKQGQITSRTPSKQRTKLVYKNGSNKRVAMVPPPQVVSNKLLKQLIAAASKIEQHYGMPQDIEWAAKNGQLYIVQSRPITTLPESQTGQNDTIAWTTVVARRHTPLFISFTFSGQTLNLIKQQTGLPIGFQNIRRSGLAFQFDKNELAAASKIVHGRVVKTGTDFFNTYATLCYQSGQSLLKTAELIGSQSNALTDKDILRQQLQIYFDKAIAHAAYLLTIVLMQLELEDFLNRFVAKRINNSALANKTISALKIATRPNHEVKNLENLLRIGQSIQKAVPNYNQWITEKPQAVTKRIRAEFPAIWKSIQKYQQQFDWMGRMYYAGDPLSTTDIVIRLQNVLRHDCAKRLHKIRANHKLQLTQRNQAIAKLGNDKDAQLVADLVAYYMYLRTYRLDVFLMAHEYVLPLLNNAARVIGLKDAQEILYLDWREIMDALQNNLPAQQIQQRVAKRRQGFEVTTIAGSTHWYAVRPQALPPHPKDDANAAILLKGSTACAGIYEGRVRIVLNDKAMLDMVAGEVLVTTMTTPSLMLAVEKAGAIVTDEGGMLCHAAIVSRELNIPCVIGTETATKILQPGMLAKVDADRAIVTCINFVNNN